MLEVSIEIPIAIGTKPQKPQLNEEKSICFRLL